MSNYAEECFAPQEKRGRGRPPKRSDAYTVRAKDDPLRNWQAEQALKKAKGDPLVAIAEQRLGDTIAIPKDLDTTSKKHYLMLYKEFTDLGIDVIHYKRVHVLLSKLYAMEEMCEKELKRIGGIAYKTSGDNVLYKEHPAAKHLHSTRALILNTLKSLGLTPTSGGGTRFEKEEPSEFSALQ